MKRERLAEEKFRPLKKRMRDTVKRLQEAARSGTLPERDAAGEFLDQVRVMVSYPGFGDAAYPELLAAGAALAENVVRRDLDGYRRALAAILALRDRCHAGITSF